MRIFVLALGLMLGLAACEKPVEAPQQAAEPAVAPPESPPVQPAMAGPPATEGVINWEAARADRASSAVTDAPVMVQSAGAQSGPPSVPVLLPSGIVQTASDRPPALVTTGDGYFATYHTPRYDAIVNGSKRAYVTSSNAQGDKESLKFMLGDGSAQLAFSRYGADYLIEFECRQLDGAESCITEAEAKAFADSLFVAQTQ